MVFSSVVVACFILFSCISQMQASVLNPGDSKVPQGAQKFKLRIMERGTRFYEKVDIDEDGQIAYFKVPAHNGLSATEELYDFKMNITIRRSKAEGACYVKPLPKDVPRPNYLKTGFLEAINRPPNYRVSTVSKYWIIGEEVGKIFLRKEVREFCDQYPVYRLMEYTPDSVSVERERIRRQTQRLVNNITVCDNTVMSAGAQKCPPNDWRWQCRINQGNCIYYMMCDLNIDMKAICTTVKHIYDSIVCCNPSCP